MDSVRTATLRQLPVAIALGAVLLMAFALSPAKAANQSVSIANFAFSPASVNVNVGDTVTWTNQDSSAHTVTSDTPGVFGSGQLAQGQTFQFTFSQAGTFAYHCAIHPTMTGTVVVAAAAGGGATASPTASGTTAPPATGTGLSKESSSSPLPLAALLGGTAVVLGVLGVAATRRAR